MATSSSDSVDSRYLVLHVTQGMNLDCWRRLRLRIVPNVEKEWLMSDNILAISNPILNIYFVWCLTENHYKFLHKQKRQAQIGIVAEKSGKSWTAGCAKIGVQYAQVVTPNVSLYLRKIPIEITIPSSGGSGLRPELMATFTVQTEMPDDKYGQIHVSHLTEPLEARPPPSSSSILKKSDAASSKTKVPKLDTSRERKSSVQPTEQRRSTIVDTSKKNLAKNVRFQDGG